MMASVCIGFLLFAFRDCQHTVFQYVVTLVDAGHPPHAQKNGVNPMTSAEPGRLPHSNHRPARPAVLHGYFRSSAAWRVRIALHLKSFTVTHVAAHLRRGEQRAPD